MTQFIKGKQPCDNFHIVEWGNTIHDCYCKYPEEICGGTVAFCKNCSSDHHSNGYESCVCGGVGANNYPPRRMSSNPTPHDTRIEEMIERISTGKIKRSIDGNNIFLLSSDEEDEYVYVRDFINTLASQIEAETRRKMEEEIERKVEVNERGEWRSMCCGCNEDWLKEVFK